MKSQIIEELGQTDILLPSLVAEGLAANDRIKVRMSALQAAVQHARAPGQAMADLQAECRAAGIAPAAIATLIGGAHMAAEGRIAAPNLARLMKDIVDDVTAMIRAVKAGASREDEAFDGRLSAMLAAGVLDAAADIEAARIARLTGMAENGADSLHRMVMDLHKALNRLAAGCAEEVIDGAHVFGLQPGDHAPVQAFMRGLGQTRALKFDHPGLDTMATRSGGRLLIQNDIGTTDAHVVVIAVKANAVTVTYTDVHRARARFFVALFDKFPATWSGLDRHAADGLGDDGTFYLVTGDYQADSADERDEFLAAVGAALVFLIDWNKARKLLRSWVAKNDAAELLGWAARHRIGHRAFLELGGDELIGAAVRNAAPTRIGFGERLDQALGRDAAVDFLKTAMRVSTEALSAGRSVRLVRDQIEAELVRHLERVDSTLLAIITRQAGLAHDIAAGLAHHLAALQAGRSADGKALAARASRIEQKADRIAIEARKEVTRLNARPVIEQMTDSVEQAVDELEQAAFIASLLPANVDPALLEALTGLCGTAVTALQAVASGLAAAAEVPDGQRVDSEDALACVVRLIDAEHDADLREREVTTRVFAGGFDVATSLSVLELARAIERTTDRLAGFGHLLRRYIISDLLA
ncbi:hypothetical protein ONR75_29255 [Rhodopseudomonas sp. P2A-2r]|uniref:hypothetical protein n=1 Tax=Rhodopseudomonas sp. P2A-2r TaxID=2991972 RepID=UPI00223413EF|nr:hypothetical protein [Rhodopseudomonas sp. P2A-2r]UZE48791.1 hypothetical protein ONR75_29255 [Rhodopseudomonas sp. P2A-2r]